MTAESRYSFSAVRRLIDSFEQLQNDLDGAVEAIALLTGRVEAMEADNRKRDERVKKLEAILDKGDG